MLNVNPINLEKEFAKLTLLEHRTPQSTTEEKSRCFAELSSYRDGAVYLGYFSGTSDWERHGSGDEVVMVFAGCTRLFVLRDGDETEYMLAAGEILVVPQGAWHRFETIGPIKSMTITPMPTDHQIGAPLL